ncbi:MAG: nucleotidyltransferase domain-containing protein [bacterium]|nr:nucleotidyltransferase domain-containing protein [bacterium]
MNKQAIFEVRKYAELLKNADVQFESLIVFGSQAKGTATPDSDIDVCVVSKSFGHDRHAERVALMKVSTDDTIDIEPHPYHPDDLANPWDSLAVEIRKYGVRTR